jgi:CRP-like cAMP-binding protein
MTSIPIAETTTSRLPLGTSRPLGGSHAPAARSTDLAPTAPPSPEHNHVLALLGEDAIARVLPHAQLRSLGSRETLVTEGDSADAVFFPLSGMLSLLARAGDQAVEVATVGTEGMLGNPLLAGRTHALRAVAPFRATVLRLDASVARDLLMQRAPSAERTRLHASTFVGQLGRAASCHHWHDVPGRCARWLLLARARTGDYFTVTQELLAELLGVRRASVNGAATRLHRLGAIDYSRGRVKIINPDALESAACACYGAFRSELSALSS